MLFLFNLNGGAQVFNAIIFDVDGTIIDTELAMLHSLQRTLKEEKNIEKDIEELRFTLGIPGKDALKMMGLEPVDELHDIWSAAVLDFSDHVVVFEGMEALLEQLKNKQIKLGIVTSKIKQSMRDEFDRFNLNHYFHDMIDADDTIKHKPEPEPLLQSLKNINEQPTDALYIGDSIYDLQAAHAANMKFALAHWGAKKTEGFEKADYILKSPLDLIEIISK